MTRTGILIARGLKILKKVKGEGEKAVFVTIRADKIY